MKRGVESRLALELASAGFIQIRKLVFKAPWSSAEVDHLICPYWLSKYGPRVSIAVGVLHHEAHKFGLGILRSFGSPLMRESAPGIHGSFIGFSLGNLCSWPSAWSLDPVVMGIEECVKEIMDCLREGAFPLVGKVDDDASMYDFLVQTKIKAFWPMNGTVLTAEAMLLGKRLGYSESRVVSDLTPFLRLTSFPIDNALTIEDFFHQVWARA